MRHLTLILVSLAAVFLSLSVAKKCSAPSNVLFLVDKSASIKADHWKLEKKFMQEMIKTFDIGPSKVRVGVVLFAVGVHKKFHFDKYTKADDVIERVSKLECPECKNGKTATGAGLEYARTTSFTTTHGMNPKGKNIVIVVTDGKSTESQSFLEKQCKAMKNVAQVIAVGAGSKIDKKELSLIASADSLVYSAEKFDDLHAITKSIADNTCQVIITGTPPPPLEICGNPLDLVFLVDTSRSLTKDEWKMQMDFVRKVSKNFKVGLVDTHISVVQYAHVTHKLFCLNQHLTNDALDKAIETKQLFFRGSTKTTKAIDYVYKNILTEACGARARIPKTVVHITDGRANDPSAAAKAAQTLKDAGAKFVSVGIGSGVSDKDLEALASPGMSFHAMSFVDLDKLRPPVCLRMCMTAS